MIQQHLSNSYWWCLTMYWSRFKHIAGALQRLGCTLELVTTMTWYNSSFKNQHLLKASWMRLTTHLSSLAARPGCVLELVKTMI